MNTKKYVALVVGIPLLLIHLSVGPPVYFAKAIEGVIVDQRTGEPLQGVVVVAEWQLYEVGFRHAGSGSRINTIEAITDANGKYHIPWWGPRIRPPWGHLKERAPSMTFFKSGYFPIAVSNKKETANLVLSSDYHKQVMKLEKFNGDFKRLSKALSLTTPDLGGCWWACPLYVLALDAEAKRLRALTPRPSGQDLYYVPLELEDLVEFERWYFLRYAE